MQRIENLSFNHFQLFIQKLNEMLAPLGISHEQTFFQELIMVLMGKHSEMADSLTWVKSGDHGQSIELALPLPVEPVELERMVRAFNQDYSDTPIRPHRIIKGNDAHYIIAYFPALKTRDALPELTRIAAEKNPEFIQRHQENFGSILATFATIARKHRIELGTSDAFEDILCKVVKRSYRYHFLNRILVAKHFIKIVKTNDLVNVIFSFLPMPTTNQDVSSKIVSAVNEFRPHPEKPFTTQLCLCMSIEMAKHIVNFYNMLIYGSAALEEKLEHRESKNVHLSIVNVTNTALKHATSVQYFTDLLAANSQDELDAYRVQSNKDHKTLASSLEELVSINDSLNELSQLQEVKENVKKRQKIETISSDKPLDKVAKSLTNLITFISRPDYKFEIENPASVTLADDKQEPTPTLPNQRLFDLIADCITCIRNFNGKRSITRSDLPSFFTPYQNTQLVTKLLTALRELEVSAGRRKPVENQPVMLFGIRRD
jgi:hypothetical protein